MSAARPPAAPRPSDPLVPKDFNDWTLNVYGIFKRSGWRITGLAAVWGLVPAVGAGWSSFRLQELMARLNTIVPPGSGLDAERARELDGVVADLFAFAGLAIAVSLLLAYFIAAGWASALRAIVTDAAGQRIGFTAALAYGARRGVGLWGWYLLVAVCVLAGAVLCLLPGLYLALAFALFAPALVFEGGNPLSRSFRLVHGAFGKQAGRILLCFAGVFVTGLVLYVLQTFLADAGLGSTGLSPSGPVDFVVDGAFALLNTVVTAVILVSGLLVTYAGAAVGNGGPANTSKLLRRSTL